MNFCPEQAVEVSHPLAVLLYYVTSYPAWLVLVNWLGQQWPAVAGLGESWLRLPLSYLNTLLALWLTYAGFVLLARVSVLNRLFTLTTPTHYYRRYTEPDTDLKDIL